MTALEITNPNTRLIEKITGAAKNEFKACQKRGRPDVQWIKFLARGKSKTKANSAPKEAKLGKRQRREQTSNLAHHI